MNTAETKPVVGSKDEWSQEDDLALEHALEQSRQITEASKRFTNIKPLIAQPLYAPLTWVSVPKPVSASSFATPPEEINAENERQRVAMAAIHSKLNTIEEKNSCGGVVFLDHVATWLARVGDTFHRYAKKTQERTWRVKAPCSIKVKRS